MARGRVVDLGEKFFSPVHAIFPASTVKSTRLLRRARGCMRSMAVTRGPRGFLPGALAAIFDLPTPPAADLPTMPETPPTIAATSLLTTVLSCAKPYNGRKKAASSAAVTGKVRQPVRRDAH